MKNMLPIARSDIHIHITREHIDLLFGRGYALTKMQDLTIPGQFACRETVEVTGPGGTVGGVVVVGPERSCTQVEISFTNGVQLGIEPPLRESGDLEGTPGCTVKGPAGEVVLEKGVIAALRHIHLHTKDAEEFGVSNGQRVLIRVPGERGVVFENVIVRVDPSYALEMHIDFDEGYAAGVEDFQLVELVKEYPPKK